MCGRLTAIGVSCLVLAWAMPVAAQSSDAGRFWGQWRGPDATGVARYGNPPTEWSETKNLRWKTEIPGLGSASPIVWGDKVFLLTAVPLATRCRRPRPRTPISRRRSAGAAVAGAVAVRATVVPCGRSGCIVLS